MELHALAQTFFLRKNHRTGRYRLHTLWPFISDLQGSAFCFFRLKPIRNLEARMSVRVCHGIFLLWFSSSGGPMPSSDLDHEQDGRPLATQQSVIPRPPAQHAVENNGSRGIRDVDRREYSLWKRAIARPFIASSGIGRESGMAGWQNRAFNVCAHRVRNLEGHTARSKRNACLITNFRNEFVRRLHPGAVEKTHRRGKIPHQGYLMLCCRLLNCL